MLLTADDVTRRSALPQRLAHPAPGCSTSASCPIVNENDTVATDEIRFGDNDRLAALVAHLVHADVLVLLSDVDALYDGHPAAPARRRIPQVRGPSRPRRRRDRRRRRAGVGTGGMVTKVEAARIATGAGIPVVLTAAGAGRGGAGRRGRRHAASTRPATAPADPAALAGPRDRPRGPAACSTPARSRPWWSGARRCCRPGSPRVDGDVRRRRPGRPGRPPAARSPAGWSTTTPRAAALLGRSTRELARELGPAYEREVVHRDDLVLLGARLRRPRAYP